MHTGLRGYSGKTLNPETDARIICAYATRIPLCVHTRILTLAHAHTQTHSHAHPQTRVHTSCTHIGIQSHSHTLTRAHTHTHVLTDTPSHACSHLHTLTLPLPLTPGSSYLMSDKFGWRSQAAPRPHLTNPRVSVPPQRREGAGRVGAAPSSDTNSGTSAGRLLLWASVSHSAG